MLQVLLPSTLATRPDSSESHTRSGFPVLQSCAQASNIFTLPSSLSGKEGIFPINVNLKMALPILKTGTKVLKDSGLGAGSPSSAAAKGKQSVSKLVIPDPRKEKFLVGFRGFDASVGLPDSPTEIESILSETDGFPITPPLKGFRSDSLPSGEIPGLPRSISELQLGQASTTNDSSYVADGFRPGEATVRNPPSYDAIYGVLGHQNAVSSPSLPLSSTNEAGPLPTKHLHIVPSVSLFRTSSIPSSPSATTSTVSSPTSSTSMSTPTSTPLIYARFPETANQNPRRISLPTRAPSTPGLTHPAREVMRLQTRSLFSQFYKSFQFTCNDTEKCLMYGYSDAAAMKVPWNIPIERALRQLWKQVMEYDTACGKVKPDGQGKRELATYHAVAMGLISSDLPSERLCTIWDRSLSFATPARRECISGWLSFTEFVAIIWMVGMAATNPSFR
ncbi:hypothetical protein TWF679_006700 [Orbilia oligospora]|uniref:Uncharacterized protein n=1 Tax=Orbilia oligospora TaxID=2813651 RepID=A0A8H8V8W0_ORBOL|nr:hypothetical protein TWF679_006700 [Orbilia oligospora]